MPVRHRMKLSPENFEKVCSGDKQFEFRLNDEKRKALQVGERVEFALLPELEKDVIVEVTSLDVFKNFSELYENLPQAVAGYTKSDFLAELGKFYSKEEEEKYEVVAIGIRLV